jgi:type VI secretion system protein VasG
MINVDIKSLLSKLNDFCANALHGAAGLCVTRTHYEVAVEHFLVKCLEDPQSDLPLILRRFEIDPGRLSKALSAGLEDFKTGNAAKPVFSPLLMELFQDAWLISSVDLTEAKIRSGAIILAFLAKPSFYASGAWADIIKTVGREALLNEFWTVLKPSSEHRAVAAEGGAPAAAEGGPSGEGFIAKYCQDFTATAREGKIDPIFGRDHEIREMVDILARRRKNNPILVGEPGVGKTAAIEGMALRIVEGDVPDMLKDVTLLGLDMGSCRPERA